jgi:phosphate:Na+ symporter
MITSFAAGSFVALVPALAAMLGANVGTTLIVQVLPFDVSALSPVLLLVGLVAFRAGSTRTRDLGRVAIALLVMSLTGKGILPLNAAIALMIGANIGTAINPLLEGSRGADIAGRRMAVGNLATRIIGAAVVMPLVPWMGRMLAQIEPDLPRAVADFHAGFNIVIALAFLPMLSSVARLLKRPSARPRSGPGPFAAALSRQSRDRVSIHRASAMRFKRRCGWSMSSIR